MGRVTAIGWCDCSWNPWYGCIKVSPGCQACYMYRDMERYGRDPRVPTLAKPPTFDAPLKWPAGLRVFTCSWSDFFIREADEWRKRAWDIIDRTRGLRYMIVTKRVERLLEADLLPWRTEADAWPHVEILVSIENADYLWRAAMLRQVPAVTRGISAEPLLGRLRGLGAELVETCPTCHGSMSVPVAGGGASCPTCLLSPAGQGAVLKIHSVIGGGESAGKPERALVVPGEPLGAECPVCGVRWYYVGQDGRDIPRLDACPHRVHVKADRGWWVQELRDEAKGAGAAYYWKQWGGVTPTTGGRVLKGRTWDEVWDGARAVNHVKAEGAKA